MSRSTAGESRDHGVCWRAIRIQPPTSLGGYNPVNTGGFTAFDQVSDREQSRRIHTVNNRVDVLSERSITTLMASNLLTGRYYFGDSDQSFPFAQLAAEFAGLHTSTPTRVQLISLSYVKGENSNQVNEARWVEPVLEGFFPEDHSFDPSSIGLDRRHITLRFGCRTSRWRVFRPIGATNSVPRSRVDSKTGTSSTTMRGNPDVMM